MLKLKKIMFNFLRLIEKKKKKCSFFSRLNTCKVLVAGSAFMFLSFLLTLKMERYFVFANCIGQILDVFLRLGICNFVKLFLVMKNPDSLLSTVSVDLC